MDFPIRVDELVISLVTVFLYALVVALGLGVGCAVVLRVLKVRRITIVRESDNRDRDHDD